MASSIRHSFTCIAWLCAFAASITCSHAAQAQPAETPPVKSTWPLAVTPIQEQTLPPAIVPASQSSAASPLSSLAPAKVTTSQPLSSPQVTVAVPKTAEPVIPPGHAVQPALGASVASPAPVTASLPFADLNLSATDRDAMGRVAFAEAGNQTEEGLAAVTYTILNRIEAGKFGSTVTAVLDAPNQFEPVTNAAGSWSNLPALSPGQVVEFNTILDLILEGRMPDPTKGALYFQNPAIVAQRANAGTVSPGLVNFGGQTPTATIRDQSFYAGITLDGFSLGAPNTSAPVLSVPEGTTVKPLGPRLFNDGNAASLFMPLTGQGATPAGLFVPLGIAPMTGVTGSQPASLGVAGPSGPATPKPNPGASAPPNQDPGDTDNDPSGALFESNSVPQIITNPSIATPSPGAIDTPAPGVASASIIATTPSTTKPPIAVQQSATKAPQAPSISAPPSRAITQLAPTSASASTPTGSPPTDFSKGTETEPGPVSPTQHHLKTIQGKTR